ncbi:MAG: hypothetical protein NT154_02315 [Verrucomicrobia bacterium]|nr:hypothetical protein [Verrucomicrobiota bacterium]
MPPSRPPTPDWNPQSKPDIPPGFYLIESDTTGRHREMQPQRLPGRSLNTTPRIVRKQVYAISHLLGNGQQYFDPTRFQGLRRAVSEAVMPMP